MIFFFSPFILSSYWSEDRGDLFQIRMEESELLSLRVAILYQYLEFYRHLLLNTFLNSPSLILFLLRCLASALECPANLIRHSSGYV